MDRDLASSAFETPNARRPAPPEPSAARHSLARVPARPQPSLGRVTVCREFWSAAAFAVNTPPIAASRSVDEWQNANHDPCGQQTPAFCSGQSRAVPSPVPWPWPNHHARPRSPPSPARTALPVPRCTVVVTPGQAILPSFGDGLGGCSSSPAILAPRWSVLATECRDAIERGVRHSCSARSR